MYVGNKRRKSAIRLLALLLAVIVCAFPQDASAAGWITFKDDWNGKLQQLSDYMVADSRNQDGSLTVTVRTRFYHHGTLGKIKWATDKIIYVDGTETAKIYSDRNASAGPGGHLAQQVSFSVRGGGSHRITSVEVPFNRPDTQAGWDFTITLPYLVVFKSGYGNNEVLKRQEVMPGGSAIAPQVNREGYNFTGWDKNFSNVHSDLTVTAQWKKKMCRVRFLTGYGNDDVIKTQMVEWGGDATAPPDPRRKGWRFTGWDRGYTNVKSDIDVRARWAPDGRIRYHADGELRYTQSGLTPGTAAQTPTAAIDACRRAACTPGWTGWFSDSACTVPWNGGNVPAGTLDLYSYNELTVSFAPTTDCAATTGTFVTAPDGPGIDYPLIPSPRTVRYGRGLSLSLPNGCLRDDGDSIYVTYRPQGYFPSASGGTPSLSLNPKQDTTVFIRWVETIAEGVETTL